MTDNYRTAIITGASSGIGAAISKQLCRNGIVVYALARDTKKLDRVRKELATKYRPNFHSVNCDISDRKKTTNAIRKIYSEKNVDLVICNAGVGLGKRLEEHSWEDIDRIISTNLTGSINILKSCLESREGHITQIVFTTSLAGKIGFPNLSVYSATKFALEGLVESLRNEYDPSQVSFTILRPGITATSFFNTAGMQDFEKSAQGLKSYYSPDKVAEIFINELSKGRKAITIGSDKYFLKILPFVTFGLRFKVLDLINKI